MSSVRVIFTILFILSLYWVQQCGLRPLISIILLLLHTSQYFSISVIFQIYAAMPQHTPLWKTNKFSSGIDMNSSETKINLQLSGSQKQHHKLIKLLNISIYVFAGFELKETIERVIFRWSHQSCVVCFIPHFSMKFIWDEN